MTPFESVIPVDVVSASLLDIKTLVFATGLPSAVIVATKLRSLSILPVAPVANTTALESTLPSRKFTKLESVISISVVTDVMSTSAIEMVPVPSSFTDTSFPVNVTESSTWFDELWLET